MRKHGFWRVLAIALGCLLAGLALARDPSEPEAVARIRADRSATLEVLQAQAMAAEQRAKDAIERAWWRLAVAEFADEAEQPEPALASLNQLLVDARQLGLRDLEFRANARMAAMLATARIPVAGRMPIGGCFGSVFCSGGGLM